MSIFSKIKGAKKAAEDHKKKAEVTSTIPEQPKAPYKHVPTHAATDSLNVGGASRDTDMRERIREQHKRRSAMPPSSQSSSRSSSRSSLRSGTELSPDQRARTFARSSSDLSIASVMQRQPVYQQSTRQRAYFSHGSIHGSSSSMCLRPSPLSATPSLTATEESLEEDEEESPVVSSQTSTKSSSSSHRLEMKQTNGHWSSEQALTSSEPAERQSAVIMDTPAITVLEPVGPYEQKTPTIIETGAERNKVWTFGRRRSSSAAEVAS